MKEIILTLVLIALIFPLVSASADIAYIIKDSTNPNSIVTNLITEEGYTYEVIRGSQAASGNFSNYGMIIVGEGDFGSYVADIPVNEKSSLIINHYHMADWHWDGGGASQLSTSQSRGEIVNASSSIAEGVSNPFYIYSQGPINFYHLSQLARAVQIKGIAAPYNSETDYVVATANIGTPLRDGKTSHAKGVFMGATDPGYWTNDTKQIFKNSLKWLIGDEDQDHDGYPAKVDCNDHDEAINPGAIEIAYDGIDQDCSGADTTDVDGDGYNAEIVGGLDCNDNNPSVHPGATDPKKNCINEAPALTRDIPTLEWNEDNYKLIDLDAYFEDPDGEDLTYGVESTSDNLNIVIYDLGHGVLRFESTENWYGEDWVVFNATDSEGLSAVSNNITLRVNSVNDAPVINNGENIYGVEGGKILVVINATDPEGDSMEYFLDSDKNFIKESDNEFSWQTSVGDKGTYKIHVRVRDSNGAEIPKEITITVLKKIVINEFVSSPSSGNEWVEIYNPSDSGFILDGCILENGIGLIANLSGEIGSKGFRVFELSNKLDNDEDVILFACNGGKIDAVTYGPYDDGFVEDNTEAPMSGESNGRNPDGKDTDNDYTDFEIFKVPTKGVRNNLDVIGPEIELISPGDGLALNGTDISLKFIARDDKAAVMDCSVYLNSNKIKTIGAENDTEKSLGLNLGAGSYSWKVLCDDGSNSGNSETRSFSLSGSVHEEGSPVIDSISDKTVNEGALIEFSVHATNEDGGNLTFGIGGKPSGADFIDNGDGTADFSWQTESGDSGDYALEFTVENELGLKDEETVKITIKSVDEEITFDDAQTCKVKSDLIDLTLRNPDDGEDFDIGEVISVETKIGNDFDDRLDFDIEAHLYDTDNDESIDSDDDSVRVRDGDSENLDLELKIPSDAEDSDYVVYVYVESEDGDCSSAYVNINIDREDDRLQISDLFVNPRVTYPGESVEVEVEVENIGGDDQDATIILEVPDLNIYQEGSEFQIERYGDDDKETKRMRFLIPSDAKEGDYELKVIIEYSGKEETKTETITITKGAKQIPNSISGLGNYVNLGNFDNISFDDKDAPEKPQETVKDKKSEEKKTYTNEDGNPWIVVMDIILVLAVIVQVLIISIVVSRRF